MSSPLRTLPHRTPFISFLDESGRDATVIGKVGKRGERRRAHEMASVEIVLAEALNNAGIDVKLLPLLSARYV